MKKLLFLLLLALEAVAVNAQKITGWAGHATGKRILAAVGPVPTSGGTASASLPAPSPPAPSPPAPTPSAPTPPVPTLPAPAASSSKRLLAGTWTGPLVVPGKALAVRLTITETGGRLSAVLSLPGSSLNHSVFAVQQRRDTLLFTNAQAQASFECRRSADGATLAGLWVQPGFREALVLRHAGAMAASGAPAAGSVASVASAAPLARPARRTRQMAEWSAGYRVGNRPVGPWEYYRPTAGGGRELACTYDHDTGLLTPGAPDTEGYEAELSPGRWTLGPLTQAPWFVGGREALSRHTSQLRYPAAAIQARTEGRVTVSLLVDTLGRVAECRVVRGIGTACDAEALRVARTIPDAWVPGRVGTRAVPVRYGLSFVFKLP